MLHSPKILPFETLACHGQVDKSTGLTLSRVWVEVPVVTLVSLSKTLYHYCCDYQMECEAVQPVCCVMHGTSVLIVIRRGLPKVPT